jgi:hypothetical protein
MTADAFRSHFSYGETWIWASLQTKLPDGRIFALSLQDGLAAGVNNKDRATEDAASIDGKVTKLGQTEFTF